MPALMKKFGCERTYPKKLYDKVVKHGSVASTWAANPSLIPRFTRGHLPAHLSRARCVPLFV